MPSPSNTWYGIRYGNVVDPATKMASLKEDFFIWLSNHRKGESGAAMFSDVEFTKKGTQGMTFYFTPAASEFAQRLKGAKPCDVPTRGEVFLLIGHKGCLELLEP